MFTSSNEVFSWLEQFINLERGQMPKSFRLDRMEYLCELSGHPERCAPSIHIAGSKGKGSVTAMLSAMLTEAGYCAARYMSPHVIDIHERITINGNYFSEDVYCKAGNELRSIAEVLLPNAVAAMKHPKASLFDTKNEEGCEPTFFELLTLYFFLCAKHGNCDVMVVETGMGGRLDSTNILDPLVSVITLIELEHTAFLGDTIEKIAAEKAGIIKNGKPVISSKQCEEALEVFKKTAKEKNSQLYYFPETTKLEDIEISLQGTKFIMGEGRREKGQDIPLCAAAPLREEFSIPIPGKVQAENAALAIAALKIAFPYISTDAIRKGLASLKLPGRFEKISDNPAFVIDGAHTQESLKYCIETFISLYGEGGVLLFGCAADKDPVAMAETAHSHFSKIFITMPGTFKASNPSEVYKAFCEKAGKEKTQLVTNTQEAVKAAIEFSQGASCKLPILGTGSFYLASEIRKFIE